MPRLVAQSPPKAVVLHPSLDLYTSVPKLIYCRLGEKPRFFTEQNKPLNRMRHCYTNDRLSLIILLLPGLTSTSAPHPLTRQILFSKELIDGGLKQSMRPPSILYYFVILLA